MKERSGMDFSNVADQFVNCLGVNPMMLNEDGMTVRGSQVWKAAIMKALCPDFS